MKRRWKVLILLAVPLAALLSPIVYVETACTAPPEGWNANGAYASVQPGTEGKRPEARSWLTYPEWYIVYSADSYGRYLAAGNAPSGFAYGRQISGFWSGLCAVNRAAAGSAAVGDAKVMLYTIGVSFTAEMVVKSIYENVFGRIAEWLGGWRSANDRYNAQVWQRYGSFMHETPWYRFGFGEALAGLWHTSGSGAQYRNWERRLALSTEYGVKSLYASAIGFASNSALGLDEPTLRFVARATPQEITAIDPRMKPVATLPGGLVVVEAPRYAQFSDLIAKLAATPVELVEIAGNDDILVTLLQPDAAAIPGGLTPLLDQPLDDRPGWRRLGLSVKVSALLPLLRQAKAGGAEIEHVYDY